MYVLHDFGEELFYGSKVIVTLRRLIRFEGKFHSFDAFLQAMHNDIYIADSFSKGNGPTQLLDSLWKVDRIEEYFENLSNCDSVEIVFRKHFLHSLTQGYL